MKAVVVEFDDAMPEDGADQPLIIDHPELREGGDAAGSQDRAFFDRHPHLPFAFRAPIDGEFLARQAAIGSLGLCGHLKVNGEEMPLDTVCVVNLGHLARTLLGDDITPEQDEMFSGMRIRIPCSDPRTSEMAAAIGNRAAAMGALYLRDNFGIRLQWPPPRRKTKAKGFG